MRLLWVFICFFSISVFAETQAELQQVSIISGKNLDTLNNHEIHRIFTLRQRLLPNNKQVKLITLPLSHPITKLFTQKVFGLYPYQLKRHWDRQIYSGKAPSPHIAKNESEVIEFIIKNPNAISYISSNSKLLLEFKGVIHVIATY